MSDARERFAVFGFEGTHEALRAESVLLDAGEEVALIPTPRALGSLCGFAVRVPLHRRDAALDELADAGIMPNGLIEIGDRA
ncbi:MAG: DUF3343 domain-containing protein [Coriobacteriia bacterium]